MEKQTTEYLQQQESKIENLRKALEKTTLFVEEGKKANIFDSQDTKVISELKSAIQIEMERATKHLKQKQKLFKDELQVLNEQLSRRKAFFDTELANHAFSAVPELLDYVVNKQKLLELQAQSLQEKILQ